MDELVVPDLLAGRRIETDEALAIEPVAGAMAAVIVVGRRAYRQIDVTEFLVRAHRRPDIGVAGLLPGIPSPRSRRRAPRPARTVWKVQSRRPVADVEAPDIAGRRRPFAPPVEHRRADHDDAAHDHRRRGHGVIVGIDRATQAFREVDPAVLAECRHRLSGFGVERDHLRERGEDHDAFVVAVAPISDAAMQPAEIGGNAKAVFVDLWIVHPFGFAGGGIDGGDLRQRSGGVEHAANHQRRRFIGNASGRRRLASLIAMSGDFQRQAMCRFLALSRSICVSGE